MNERNRELISAYLDGELDADEVAELSDAWRRSPELRDVTVRYASVGELMRGARASAGQPPIANRVRARMAEEVAAEAEFSRALAEVDAAVQHERAEPATSNNIVRPRFGRTAKTMGSLALAASVAAIAIVGVRQFSPSDSVLREPSVNTSVARADSVQVSPTVVSANAQRHLGWTSEQPADQRRLNAYLVRHSEVSGRGRGMLPYARIVGYEPPRD